LHRGERDRIDIATARAQLSGEAPAPPVRLPQPRNETREPITLNPVDPEHRCYRAEHCATAQKIDQTACTVGCRCHAGYHRCDVRGGCHPSHETHQVKIGAEIVAAQGLCITCQRITTDAITELPRDYVELTQALQLGTVGLAELVAATKDLPAPLRVSVAALKAELVRVAATWAEPVAERLNIDWDSQRMDRHARPGYVLQRASALLTANLPVLLALRDFEVRTWAFNGTYNQIEPGDGIAAALELLNLHRITRAALGQTKLVHELPAPCPNCDHMTLVRDDGDDNVHCRRCRLQWPENDYRRLTLVVAADYAGEQPRPARRISVRSGVQGTVARPIAR